MSNVPARRQVLKAVAASGIVAPIAGCVSSFETDDRTPDGANSGRSRSDDEDERSACTVGRTVITAFDERDGETIVDTYPFEHLEQEIDEDEFVEEVENSDLEDRAWIDGEITEIGCACAEHYPESARAELASEFTGEVTTVMEVRYEVTYTVDGETATETEYVNAVEIEDEWYGLLDHGGGPTRCGTPDGRTASDTDGGSGDDSGTETSDEQPLEPADWDGVDEIVLEGTVANWVGVEPAPIEGIENPTLLLFEGREYTIEWRNGDGLVHNLQLRDDTEESIAETELVESKGGSASLTIEATAAMDHYVCEPHAPTMVGDIEIEAD